MSLHGFREQSKLSKGFHSNKKVEKHWARVIDREYDRPSRWIKEAMHLQGGSMD